MAGIIPSRINPISSVPVFGVNDIDETIKDFIYIGKEDNTGKWLIMKVDESQEVTDLKYASILNNPTINTYSEAWTGRTTLTYGNYNEAV